MSEPNVYETAWDLDATDAPMGGKAARVGAHAGARDLGASVYELQPGGAVSPYHLHHGNEELLVVLAGRPAVRTEAGTRTLEPGDVVAFPAGPGGAHRVVNTSEEVVRVLLVSTMRFPEVAEHIDTGAILTLTGPAAGHAFPAGTERPFPELYVAGMQAAAEREAGPGRG